MDRVRNNLDEFIRPSDHFMPLARRPRPSPPPAPLRLFRLFRFVFLPPVLSSDAALASAIMAATPFAALPFGGGDSGGGGARRHGSGVRDAHGGVCRG